LIQNENRIIIVGSIAFNKDFAGAKIRGCILRSDKSLVHILFDTTVNLQTINTITLKDLNNGEDIAFSMEYLHGKYIVIIEITGRGGRTIPKIRMI
jgi:hypothetical protein